MTRRRSDKFTTTPLPNSGSISFYKHGKLITESEKQHQQSETDEEAEKRPNIIDLINLPSGDQVEKMWKMKDPSDATIRQVWNDMLSRPENEKEKELVLTELNDWVRSVMRKRIIARRDKELKKLEQID